jgi:hypothetical protein
VASFVAASFGDVTPDTDMLWLTGGLRMQAQTILGHEPAALRVRYWRHGDRTAWVLEEIGKEQPITSGWVVENGEILQSRVLAFRESRGWEIHQKFFTDRFSSARLDGKLRLDRQIDGISGATLSVDAMRRMARLALLFHQRVVAGEPAAD